MKSRWILMQYKNWRAFGLWPKLERFVLAYPQNDSFVVSHCKNQFFSILNSRILIIHMFMLSVTSCPPRNHIWINCFETWVVEGAAAPEKISKQMEKSPQLPMSSKKNKPIFSKPYLAKSLDWDSDFLTSEGKQFVIELGYWNVEACGSYCLICRCSGLWWTG